MMIVIYNIREGCVSFSVLKGLLIGSCSLFDGNKMFKFLSHI